jgi:alpha-L-fucosidase
VRAARDGGARFAILTVTHETGFALYQSDVNPYSLKAVKWKDGKGDILRDFIASCHKYGIKPGVYIGIRWNSFMGVYDFKVQGNNAFAANRQAYYNRYCEQMTTEILSRYGKLFFIWFDGGAHGPEQGGPNILPIAEKYQPEAIFYHNLQRADVRWGGSESGTVPYPCWSTFGHPSWMQHRGDSVDFRPIKYGDPDGKYYMPAMSDAPLRGFGGRHEWFWEPNDERAVFPVNNLVNMYYNSIGHNSTLILGLTPNADGLLPAPDADTLRVFGQQIAGAFSRPVAATRGEGNTLLLPVPGKKTFDRVLVSEAVAQGQRIREFRIEGLRGRKWETIVSGTSVGHKFIHRLPAPVQYDQVRLVVTKAVGVPVVGELGVY